MKKYLINILIWTTSVALTACSGQEPGKSGANTKVANDSSEIYYKTVTAVADSLTISNVELTKIYSRAIADYIKGVYKKNKTVYDTLYIGKRNFGQPDDFPNIELPETIENTKIRLIDPEVGKKLQEVRKSWVYINMIGWVDKKRAEFIFVTFSNGIEHKFDFYIHYKHNDTQNEFLPEKSRIEVVILNKKGKADHFAVYEEGKYIGDKPIN
jgi:hypothetical protein